MPLLKKKVYTLVPIPEDIKTDEEVFVIPETGECFRTYEYPLNFVIPVFKHFWP